MSSFSQQGDAKGALPSSYSAILKSSALIGGSQFLVYFFSLIRTKFVAVLLGTTGVGLVGIYNSLLGISNVISNLGLTSSGVREIAAARTVESAQEVDEIRVSIFRIATVAGLIGAIILAALSSRISQLLFENKNYSAAIALLGSVLLFNGINVAQRAVIQGYREIASLAKMSIYSALVATLIAVAIYFPFRELGIVPVLILTSLINIPIAYYYSRKIGKIKSFCSWSKTWYYARKLVPLGASVALGMLLAEGVQFFCRGLIIRELGLSANGLYVAAFAISGLFVNFILSAMTADYLPRLSGVSEDVAERNRMINEQVEIGILSVLPCVVLGFIFAPIIMNTLYSSSFTEASSLLRWFLLGVATRVINWPLGMLMLARGDSKLFFVSQLLTSVLHVFWIYFFFNHLGLVGAAIAFGINNLLAVFIYSLGGGCIYRFYWNSEVLKFFAISLLVALALVFIFFIETRFAYYTSSGFLSLFTILFCLRGLIKRVGLRHRYLSRLSWFLPFLFLASDQDKRGK